MWAETLLSARFMTGTITPQDALKLWQSVLEKSLHTLPHDLSQRQMAVLLSVYFLPPPHTLRSLSARLKISKPAVCRAVDALSRWDLVRRKKDESDRRNVFLNRTIAGSVFLRDFADIIVGELRSPAPDPSIANQVKATG